MPAQTAPCTCRLPDIVLIAWIPDAPAPGTIAAFLRRWNPRRAFAAAELYRSGNPAPPAVFSSLAAVRQHFAPFNPNGSREHRAIAILEAPLVIFDQNVVSEGVLGMPQVDVGDTMEVGYTPIRPPGTNARRFSKRLYHKVRRLGGGTKVKVWPLVQGTVGWAGPAKLFRPLYLRGAAPEHEPVMAWDPAHPHVATIWYRAEFKLGRFANYVGRLLTGYWAPHAWMDLVIEVQSNGALSVSVAATAVPSVTLYVSDTPGGPLSQRDTLDMRASPPEAFDAFVETKSSECHPAPFFTFREWRGSAFCQ